MIACNIIIIVLCSLPQYPATPISVNSDSSHPVNTRTRRSIVHSDGLFQGDIILNRRQKAMLEEYGYGKHSYGRNSYSGHSDRTRGYSSRSWLDFFYGRHMRGIRNGYGRHRRDTGTVSNRLEEKTQNNTATRDDDGHEPSRILNRKPRNAARDFTMRWKNGIVNYYYKPHNFTYAEKRRISKAMHILESVSCVKFRQKYYYDRKFLVITRDSDPNSKQCAGAVGYSEEDSMKFRSSAMCLSDSISILHELFHVLGFWHMQNHPDRNYYINIHVDNIDPEYRGDFDILSGNLVTDFGVPYDCSSIMHYGPISYPRLPGLTTMSVRYSHLNSCFLGKDNRMTAKDICKLNRMYGCKYDCRVSQYFARRRG